VKKIFFLILFLLMTSCGPADAPATEQSAEETEVIASEVTRAEPTEPIEDEGEEPQPVETATTEATEERATEVEEGEPTEDGQEEAQPIEVTPSSPTDETSPAITPDEASVVRASDHVLGATEPLVVIIEYGDFQ
jgi:hypothetical protein